jgi:hypothetical protein
MSDTRSNPALFYIDRNSSVTHMSFLEFVRDPGENLIAESSDR